jgi:very-short-patch-repair endonuclease
MMEQGLYRPPTPCLGGFEMSEENKVTEVSPYTGRYRGARWMTADPMEYELLKANARSNRKNMTEAESVFWSLVKSSSLGQRCLRQHIIGDYIVDFLFRKSKVVVEIDGGYHFTEEQQKDDEIRTDWLESQGYKVVRFTNEQVLCDTDSIINELKVSLNREI